MPLTHEDYTGTEQKSICATAMGKYKGEMLHTFRLLENSKGSDQSPFTAV